MIRTLFDRIALIYLHIVDVTLKHKVNQPKADQTLHTLHTSSACPSSGIVSWSRRNVHIGILI